MWCIPPGMQQITGHHAHYHHHHHAHLYNINPDAGDLIPTQPPRPAYQPAPTRTAAPRASLFPRHQSRVRSRRRWPLPRR